MKSLFQRRRPDPPQTPAAPAPKTARSRARPSPTSEEFLGAYFGADDALTIFDVGAHHGQSARKYAGMFPNAKIYSFEPFPESFAILSALEIDRLTPVDLGLSSEERTETFQVNAGSATNSLLPLSENAKTTWGGNKGLEALEEVACRFTTLDAFMVREGLKRIDFMKLDVQGAEFKVLEGAKATLGAQRIGLIQMEIILGDTYAEQKPFSYYLDQLAHHGYRLRMVSDLVVVEGQLVQMDAFFEA